MLSQILKETFVYSWWKTFISGSIGGTFTYFTVGKSLGLEPWQSLLVGLAVLILIYAFRLVYVIGKISESTKLEAELNDVKNKQLTALQEDHERLRLHFGNAMTKLNTAFSAIDYLRSLEKGSEGKVEVDRFIALMRVVCNNLRDIFEQHRNLKYSVSIKLPVKRSESMRADSRVMNIVRDDASNERDNPAYQEATHTISNNTCFNFIFNGITSQDETTYYLNNNIPNTANYTNSSFRSYGNRGLPYKSEFVVPIIASYDEQIKFPIGFLCLDCNESNGFDPNVDNNLDVIMLEGVAEGIYDVVLDYSEDLNSDDYIQAPKNNKFNFKPKDRKRRNNR